MKVFLGVLLAISVIVNIFLLASLKSPKQKKSGGDSTKPQEENVTQLREIAKLCGVTAEQTKNMNSKELLEEVKTHLFDAETCQAITLPQEKMEFIEIVIGNKNKYLFTIIQEQDQYISKLSGKKFIILPSQKDE